MAEDRKPNQGQGPGGMGRQDNQEQPFQGFQGGGRTGTPFKPHEQGQAASSRQGATNDVNPSGQAAGKEGERRAPDADASRGQSGRTAAGDDTRPL